MKKLFTNHKKVALILGIISLLFLFFLNSRINYSPQEEINEEVSPQKIESSNSKINQLNAKSFSFSPNLSLNFPDSLPIYPVSEPPEPELKIISDQLIQIYNLQPVSNIPNYYSSRDNSIIFRVDTKNMYVSYSIDGNIKPNLYLGNNPPTLEPAVNSAKIFLQALSQYRNLELQNDQITYYQVDTIGDDFHQVSNPSEANLITLPFSRLINNVPYRYSNAITSPALITVGQNNQVVRAVITSQPFPDLSESEDTPLLTPEEILNQLNLGKTSVVYAPLYNFPKNVTELPPTSINKARLEYRYDPNIKTVIPYFLLTGEFVPNKESNIPVSIQLILPAVSLPN